MPVLTTILIVAAGWIAFTGFWAVFIQPRLSRGPGRDAVTGTLWWVTRIYTRLVHKPTVLGREHVPTTPSAGPLVVVSNHTGSADPLLIQAQCAFQIRWLMAKVQMASALDDLWRQQDMIPVARDGNDSGAIREAIRHLKNGGVVGIFPEGRIVDPPRRVWPFHNGVGLLVSRSKAPVLLVWVSGTPDTTSMMKCLTTPSEARIEFIEMIEYPTEMKAAAITADLRNRFAKASGWPLSDEVTEPAASTTDPFAV